MEHIAPTMKPYILKDIPTAQKMTSFPRPKMGKTTVCALPYPQLHVDAHKSATRYAVSHKVGLKVLMIQNLGHADYMNIYNIKIKNGETIFDIDINFLIIL